jgi:hypothetical protein
MTDRYILTDKKAVPCEDLMKWAKGFETADRIIKRTNIGIPAWKYYLGKLFKIRRFEPVLISTVFLGLNHRFGEGSPLLFETMVFGGKLDEAQERYSTYEEAEKGHEKMVNKVKATL